MNKLLFILPLIILFLPSCDKDEKVFLYKLNVRNIDSTSVEIVGDMRISGNGNTFEMGIAYSDQYENPYYWSDQSVVTNTSNGYFSVVLSNLKDSTTYYVSPYYYESGGYSIQGETSSFTTLKSPPQPIIPPGIGDIGPAGGTIFFVDTVAGIGMEVSPNIITANWGCMGFNITGTDTTFGSGLTNSNLINSGCLTPNIAAEECLDLVSAGYSNWYLPSLNELQLIHQNLVLGGFLTFPTYIYSSSEKTADYAYSLNMSTGATVQLLKEYSGTSFKTIAIHEFDL